MGSTVGMAVGVTGFSGVVRPAVLLVGVAGLTPVPANPLPSGAGVRPVSVSATRVRVSGAKPTLPVPSSSLLGASSCLVGCVSSLDANKSSCSFIFSFASAGAAGRFAYAFNSFCTSGVITSLPSIRLRTGAAGLIANSSMSFLVTLRVWAAVSLSGTNGTSVRGFLSPSTT